MSQRRGAKESGGAVQKSEEILPFSKVLDNSNPSSSSSPSTIGGLDPLQVVSPPNSSGRSAETSQTEVEGAVSLDERYHAETQQHKTKQWQESHFARGFTEATWEAEYAKYKNNWKGACMQMMDNNERDSSVPCGCCSAIMCSFLGAGRIGNMTILKQSTEWITEEVPDEENPEGGTKTNRFTQPRLDFVVGPYWPMLCMITYPLILGVSGVTLVTVIPKVNPLIGLVWAICTIGLIFALAMTAFRDPGILRRYNDPPPGQEGSQWRWNDRALSYRPRGSW